MIAVRSHRRLVLVFGALVFALPGHAQNATQSDQPPCIARDETIYGPGDKKVKPPKMDVKPSEQMPSGVKGRVVMDLVVNSEGQICNVQVKTASDRAAALRVARHVADYWKFKPATLDGKPVAVKITVNFDLR